MYTISGEGFDQSYETITIQVKFFFRYY